MGAVQLTTLAPVLNDAPENPWLRLASYPDRNPGNPYVELFYRALTAHGIAHTGRLVADRRWLAGEGRHVDVVHVHWPERLWRGKRPGRLDRVTAVLSARSARGVWRLRGFLAEAKRRGVTCVWTVHNVAHHEGTSLVDRWGYRQLARGADLLLCFSEAAASELRARYGAHPPVLVISHGSYAGAYPAPPSRAAARVQFGLQPDVPVVSCLGLLRPYKGVELACDAVERLGGVQLLIAGQAQRLFDLEGLRARARSSDGRIVVEPRSLTDAEFSAAMAASDAVLLPYHAVTGSGVMFAAWTLGAGVIASDLPFFREMLQGRPECGRTFPAGDGAALAAAISDYLTAPAAARRDAIAAAVRELAPEQVVVPFVHTLRQRHATRAAGNRDRS